MSPANMATFWARSVSSEVDSVKSTFSSWDKCMSKAYCKWPVIVAIIIGSVIVICILGCIINCLCCGYQCCKCCCGCCCPSGRRKNKQPKYYDEPTPYNQQPPPPQPNPHTAYTPSPAPPVYRGAVQTATFDNPKSPGAKIDEDALPAMPTWAAAVDKHVEDPSHHDDVEMEPLNPHTHPDRKQGASPLHVATSFSDYPSDRTASAPGYRGFTPTDPYARRSPGPAAALAAAQDPYGRRSPGMPAPAHAAQDPYARRSPGPQAMMDPYGRRSPGPAAAYGAAQDPYARRSPGLASPVGAPSPYDQHNYNQQGYDHQQQQSYDEYHNGAGAGGYHAVTSQSPVSSYQQHNTTYNAMPASYSPSSEHAHTTRAGAGFQRQPSFGSSQYPPTYTSHPASPPPPFQSTAGSEYGAHEYAAGVGVAVGGEPGRERPPSLLQSGRRPAPGTYRDV